MGVVRIMYMLKVAEISSGRSLKPNIPRELKLGYVLWLQRLKKTGKAVGGKGHLQCRYALELYESISVHLYDGSLLSIIGQNLTLVVNL